MKGWKIMKNFAFDIQRFVAQKNQSVHSGNTIFLKIGGYVVGRAQALDGRRSFGTEGVYEIGSIMPQEHVNNRYEGTVSLERFLIRKSDLAKAGVAALGEEILTRDLIDIEVISKYDTNTSDNAPSSQTVRVYRGCTCVDYSETFRVGAISGENATFQYLSCDNGTVANMNNEYGTMGDFYNNTTWTGANSDVSVTSPSTISGRLAYKGDSGTSITNSSYRTPGTVSGGSGGGTGSGGNG